jgi:hypothetical protein
MFCACTVLRYFNYSCYKHLILKHFKTKFLIGNDCMGDFESVGGNND